MTTNKPTPLYGPNGTIVYNADGSKAMTTNKPEVVAYLHTNKENPGHRGVSLYHDSSCTSTLTNTEPLIHLSDYEKLAQQQSAQSETAEPIRAESVESYPAYKVVDAVCKYFDVDGATATQMIIQAAAELQTEENSMNWDNARVWADSANENKQPERVEPNWSWDCGLKLDFDGGLMRVSSRFYQCGEDIFDGSVSFYISDVELFKREFSSRPIDVLKKEVEEYVKAVTENIQQLCSTNLDAFDRVK